MAKRLQSLSDTRASKGQTRQRATDKVSHKMHVGEDATQLASRLKQKDYKTMADDNIPSVIKFSEDLSNAEQPDPLPKGDYPAEIRGAERKTSGKGNEYAAVTFYIAPESYPADYTEGNEDGTVLTYNRVMLTDTPQGRYRIRKFLEAVGGKLGKQLDLNDLIGLNASVTVDHEMYEGENRANIKKVNPA